MQSTQQQLDEYVEYDSNPLHRRDSAGNYEKQKLIRGGQATSTHYYEEDDAAGADQLPLHAAAYYGKFSTLSELLHGSSDEISERDSNGNSVIHYCCEGGDRSLGCLALLLNTRGIDINARNIQGATALMTAARRGHENAMQSLLISGCARNLQDSDGNTALHLSSMFGSKACVEALLANGADGAVRNNDGSTYLDVAVPDGMCAPADNNFCCVVS
jgi:ankyrin repeat protein